MFSQMGSFDEPIVPMSNAPEVKAIPRPVRRKSLKSQLIFLAINLLVITPTMVVIYLTIVAHGLRSCLSVFATRLSRLPIPGSGMLAQYDGFNRLDIAAVTSLVLCVTVAYVWYRVFLELAGHGRLRWEPGGQGIMTALFAAIAFCMIAGDCGLFYLGLTSQTSSGWDSTSTYVCIGATILYSIGLAFVGGLHADYHTTESS
ncbi:hypothetical protein [Rhodopirellula bahusiensis]|uniref:hypothetical protein n=2 Tax=Rhodopirellula bahusiensis TaxID=2014065 RepID=UPI003263B652